MNVLITLYTTAWGGAEESVLDLAKEIAAKGINTTVLWVSNYPACQKLMFQKNFRLVRLQISPKWYTYLASFIVAILCLRLKINVVNLNWRFVREESRYLKLLQVKSVATVRAILIDKSNADEFKNTDAIIGVSKAATRRLKKIGYTNPLFTIYNGVKISQLKLFNSIDYDRAKILSMSRLVAWKRIDWTIRAVCELRKKGLPLYLDIYGEGIETDNLSRMIQAAKATEYIKIKGFVGNNDSALSKYGIFVIPSYKEPFGKTIVENVLRKRVLVGSKSGGIPELLPRYPLLFNYMDYHDYVKKIELAYLKYSKYQSLISSYTNYFRKTYDMRRVAEDYIKVYNQL
jgi:glycosyltransferase involved in cell wall biosynthesis